MNTTPLSPFANTNPTLQLFSGPLTAEVLVLDEVFSVEEAHRQRPFTRSAAFEFKNILREAGLDFNSCAFSAVYCKRPLGGKISALFEAKPRKTKNQPLIPAVKGCYPVPDLKNSVHSLQLLISQMPNLRLIIGLGNLPLWALADGIEAVALYDGVKTPAGIMKWRGSQLYTTVGGRTIPFLPVVSPDTILREWSLRYTTVHDLKARAARFLRGELSWTAPTYDFRYIPDFEAISTQLQKWHAQLSLGELKLAVDIETWKRQWISCIGLADATVALCIPFFKFSADGRLLDCFSSEQEVALVLKLKTILSHPNVRIIGQNFIYDTQFLQRHWGLLPTLHFDTMLAHHLLWPGTPKGLHHLASLYCSSYVYWKDESQDWNAEEFSAENLWQYNCKDIRETFSIYLELSTLITRLQMQSQWEFQLEQWHLARDMMRRGVRVNQLHMKDIRAKLVIQASHLEGWLMAIMPPDLQYSSTGTPWYSSPRMQQDIFYHYLGLPVVLHKKTKRPTLDAQAIAELKEKVPLFSSIFQALEDLRSISVFRSHFLDVNLSVDNRLRCNFNVGGTETFRWSSSSNGFGEGTNLQNIPKGDD